jgi:hypothetical protein
MKKNIITEAIQYHKENKIPYSEPIFRYGSVNFFKYINELRKLNESKQVELDEDAKFFISTDLGKIGKYNGQDVLLDFPMIETTINEISRVDYLSIWKWLKKVKTKVTPKMYAAILKVVNMSIIDPYENAKSIIDHIVDQFGLAEFGLAEGIISEADYKGKSVDLNSPKRGGSKKFYVYVKSDAGNVKKISFGDTSGLTSKIKDPKARKAFSARHQCDKKKDKTKAGYWACNLPRYWDKLGGGSKISSFW